MAKQKGVRTLTCFFLDTCEDKHWFPWLTLTQCWVNTHPNYYTYPPQPHAVQQLHRHHGCVSSFLDKCDRTNSGSSRYRTAWSQMTHIYSHYTQHILMLWFTSLQALSLLCHAVSGKETETYGSDQRQKLTLSYTLTLESKTNVNKKNCGFLSIVSDVMVCLGLKGKN